MPTWEEVARDHGRFLYTVAYRLTGNDEDARDIVQDALLRVRRGLETYTPGSLEGWLARIVTNVFLDDVRRRKRRPAVALPDDPDLVVPASAAADEAAAAAGLPAEIQDAIDEVATEMMQKYNKCCSPLPSTYSIKQMSNSTAVAHPLIAVFCLKVIRTAVTDLTRSQFHYHSEILKLLVFGILYAVANDTFFRDTRSSRQPPGHFT